MNSTFCQSARARRGWGLCSLWGLIVATGGLRGADDITATYFSYWPAGTDPREIGLRVAENWAERKFIFETGPGQKTVHYAEICTWYGALEVAHLTGNAELEKRLIARADRFLGDDAKHLPERRHVDDTIFGAAPLEIYLLNQDERSLQLGLGYADRQWEDPREDGLSRESRFWIDDMYMLTILQVQAYRATGNAAYIDRAGKSMVAYLERLQQPNGLFFHTADSPMFWGRGNGWCAAGMTELLRALPAGHPTRERVLDGYRLMMSALLKCQAHDGMWRQLVDQPDAWPETSCTGMFAFAMVTGVKHGWLDAAEYGPAARKAWMALVGYLDDEANLREVCVGTGKAFTAAGPDLVQQKQFYLDRPREVGNLHGQAPVLWTAAALLRK